MQYSRCHYEMYSCLVWLCARIESGRRTVVHMLEIKDIAAFWEKIDDVFFHLNRRLYNYFIFYCFVSMYMSSNNEYVMGIKHGKHIYVSMYIYKLLNPIVNFRRTDFLLFSSLQYCVCHEVGTNLKTIYPRYSKGQEFK
jgi:hypothetical protein